MDDYRFNYENGAGGDHGDQKDYRAPAYESGQGYSYSNSYYRGVPAPGEPPKKKKNNLTLKIVAGCLCCLLLGGVLGVGGSALFNLAPWSESAGSIADLPAVFEHTPQNGGNGVPQLNLHEGNTMRTAQNAKTKAEIYRDNVGSIVGISTQGTTTNIFGQTAVYAATGTGFVISEDGYILTNCHVVEGGQDITVTLFNGETYTASVIGQESKGTDVAVIKIDATGLTPVTLGSSDTLVVGEDVVAIGNPLGELTYTMTSGIVSALDRAINIDGTPINMFQIDAAINSGNSGGPLFNCYGEVVGIVTAKTKASGIEGLGFAIPINDAAAIASDLVNSGYVTGRPYLGITVQRDGVSATLDTTGVYVISVADGSCAEKAGLKPGDVITMIGSTAVSSSSELTAAINTYRAGDTVDIALYRGGEKSTLKITFDEKNPLTEAANQLPETELPKENDDMRPNTPNPYGDMFPWFGNPYSLW